MRIEVVTLFPEFVAEALSIGILGRAIARGQVGVRATTPREFAEDPHRTVDDRPYGGGPGMVMKYEPMAAAIDAARESAPAGSRVVCLSPQGEVFDQAMAKRYAGGPGLILLAGRYEGFDERLIETHVDEEVSIGDFVLSGGEIAAMVVIDAVTRLIPGVLGDEDSAEQDSFTQGLLDHPHYTRPELVDGKKVPEVLLSGDHARIARWRYKQALGRSFLRRPDLVRKLRLNDEQQRLLDEFLRDQRTTAADAGMANESVRG